MFIKNSGNYAGPRNPNCSPRKHIFFAKVHKAASTAVQNLLLRYAKANNLIVALPPMGINHLNYPNDINFTEILPPSKCTPNKKFDMIVHHAVFNYEHISPHLHADTVYVGILRDPAEGFESYYNYFHCKKHFGVNLSEFMKNPDTFAKKIPGAVLRNVQSLDLGLRSRIFR